MTVISQPGKWRASIVPGGLVAGPCVCVQAWCLPCWGLGNLAAARKSKSLEKLENPKIFSNFHELDRRN